MNCPNCGAPLTLVPERNYFKCDYCSSIHVPEPTIDRVRSLGEPAGLDCPICRQELVRAALDDIRVLHCENCKGILFNQAVFAPVVQYLRAHTPELAQKPRPIQPAELKREVLCPSCGRKMETHPYGGPGNIVIDTCARCSQLWLDYSELQRVITAPGRDRGEWFALNRRDEPEYE